MSEEFTTGDLSQSFELPADDEDTVSKKILETLFTKKDLNFKTEISDKEIKILARLTVLAGLLDMKEIKTLIKEFKELRISKTRKGRNELVEALIRGQQQRRMNRLDAFKTAFTN